MNATDSPLRTLRRRLMLRDTLTFCMLALVTIALFAVTLFLFRSFSAHRVELAQRWYGRGQRDLAAGQAQQAVTDLRTALAYAPAERNYQLLLAQALGEAGDTEEADAYFTNLWESEPGSGPLNLDLARLSAKKSAQADAIRYYRAAIYGNWEGDGLIRRREVRLELIRYLIGQKDSSAARNEMLIASGNSPEDASSLLEMASLMAESGDFAGALPLFEKVISIRPDDPAALAGAGDAAYELGHYGAARKYLLRASEAAKQTHDGKLSPSSTERLAAASRILALSPAADLPESERISRIVRARTLALDRLNACELQTAARPASSTSLQDVNVLWKTDDSRTLLSRLRDDPAAQQSELQLIYRTEEASNQACGPASGDDALLALMARSPGTINE